MRQEIEEARDALQRLTKFVAMVEEKWLSDKAEPLQAPTRGKWPDLVALFDPANMTAFRMKYVSPYPLSPGQVVSCHVREAVFLEGIGLDANSGEVQVVIDEECVLSLLDADKSKDYISLSRGKSAKTFQACVLRETGAADQKRRLGFFLPNGSTVQVHASGPVTCHAALYTSWPRL